MINNIAFLVSMRKRNKNDDNPFSVFVCNIIVFTPMEKLVPHLVLSKTKNFTLFRKKVVSILRIFQTENEVY